MICVHYFEYRRSNSPGLKNWHGKQMHHRLSSSLVLWGVESQSIQLEGDQCKRGVVSFDYIERCFNMDDIASQILSYLHSKMLSIELLTAGKPGDLSCQWDTMPKRDAAGM